MQSSSGISVRARLAATVTLCVVIAALAVSATREPRPPVPTTAPAIAAVAHLDAAPMLLARPAAERMAPRIRDGLRRHTLLLLAVLSPALGAAVVTRRGAHGWSSPSTVPIVGAPRWRRGPPARG